MNSVDRLACQIASWSDILMYMSRRISEHERSPAFRSRVSNVVCVVLKWPSKTTEHAYKIEIYEVVGGIAW